jgi:3-deoxy-D-manno-octulosonate 8-phosphate phosphatase (KDO 8-P phosphatase)
LQCLFHHDTLLGMSLPTEASQARLRAIRLLCLDVDGVLTDGHLYWSPGGIWSQRFHVRDGYGLKLLMDAGVQVAILSGGDVLSGRDRAISLGITHAHFGIADKVAAYHEVAGPLGISLAETAFIGDELVDLPLLTQVGFSATVPEAVPEVQAAVHHVTQRPGGAGAVREICDLIRAERARSR